MCICSYQLRIISCTPQCMCVCFVVLGSDLWCCACWASILPLSYTLQAFFFFSWILFALILRSLYMVQVGLQLMHVSDPPDSGSQIGGNRGTYQCTRILTKFWEKTPTPFGRYRCWKLKRSGNLWSHGWWHRARESCLSSLHWPPYTVVTPGAVLISPFPQIFISDCASGEAGLKWEF